MLKVFVAGLGLSFAIYGAALAQTCSIPNTFSNGSTADAVAFNGNFTSLKNCAVNTTGGTLTGGALAGTTSLPGSGAITSAGSVGLGTASPVGLIDTTSSTASDGNWVYFGGNAGGATGKPSTSKTWGLMFGWNASAGQGESQILYGTGAGATPILQFGRWSGSARTIDMTLNGGNFYVATSTTVDLLGTGSGLSYVPDNDLAIATDSNSNVPFILNHTNSSTGFMIAFRSNGTGIGSVSSSTTSVSYNTTSDYRLKTDMEPMTDGLARVMKLEPKRFHWKADPRGPKVDGMIAHEIQAVIPEAVTGKKDAVNRDGSINPQMVDYSKLVPLLVAAIKDEQAEIEQLKAQVAALKSAH